MWCTDGRGEGAVVEVLKGAFVELGIRWTRPALRHGEDVLSRCIVLLRGVTRVRVLDT